MHKYPLQTTTQSYIFCHCIQNCLEKAIVCLPFIQSLHKLYFKPTQALLSRYKLITFALLYLICISDIKRRKKFTSKSINALCSIAHLGSFYASNLEKYFCIL